MTDFDYSTWAAQGRANADKLPDGVAEALGPERDWADELVESFHSSAGYTLAEFLRERCQPISNDTVTDEWRKALKLIAAPLDCGCLPCRGQCRSQDALQCEIEVRQDIALAALAKVATQ